jgi:trehalose 6-phosphate synthase/phosphatase
MFDPPEPVVRREIDARLRSIGMIAIHLSRREVTSFYRRYANGVLWPVMHDMPAAEHHCDDWETFHSVNAHFADEIAREVRIGDVVWVHDYHLMLVPRLVRERCPWARIGFFLHTPFPTLEAFGRLPHAPALLDGLLGADVIGVHTHEYVRNLLSAMHALGRRGIHDVAAGDRVRTVRLFACPMSVDANALGTLSARAEIAGDASRLRGAGPLFVGVDRLNSANGIPQRLRAFDLLLERDASLHRRAQLVQVVVPSREDVRGYKRVRQEVEATVARINSRWGTADWQPVDYRYGNIGMKDLVTLYRAADVMLVTPLRDGMNLVAKEFAASRVDDDGVLVLSERAGAAAELRSALLVDPTNERALVDAYIAALTMLPAERRVRMRQLRLTVATHDAYRWAECVLNALVSNHQSRSHASPLGPPSDDAEAGTVW